MSHPRAIDWTPAMDDAIRHVYLNRQRGGNRRLSRQFGVKPRAISARAARLRLPSLLARAPGPDTKWTPAEIELVRRHAPEPILKIRAVLIRKGFTRSEAAIRGLTARMRARGDWPSRADALEDRDALLLPAIAAGLGVGLHTVQRWIKVGRLRARQGAHHQWIVRWRDLRAFMIEHPTDWDPRAADRWFLIDALTYSEKSTLRRSP